MVEVSLNGPWEIASAPDGQGDPSQLDWRLGHVPGMVQGALLADGALPDPLVDRNAERWRAVAEQEWWYRRTFPAPEHDGPIELHFAGLDTFAEIYLNGEQVATSENMFLPLTIDVTGHMRRENELLVRLRSPIAMVEGKEPLPFWNGTGEKVWARKAQVSYGWDFTPPLITTGIWREVCLRLVPPVALRDLRVQTEITGLNTADLILDLDLERVGDGPEQVAVRFTLTDGDRTDRWTATVGTSGVQQITRYCEGIKYWWPHSMGEPHLYTLHLVLTDPHTGATIDERSLKVGFRTIHLATRDAKGAATFLFHINGYPVFCKGANWIPQAPLLLSDAEGYQELLGLARSAHMNMVRIWGGGIYEHDAFYEQCDALGIMVWQDFMWGCAQYPTDPAYLESSRLEAEAQVRRLRNHPSIVLWAGDNENDMGFHATGHRLNRKVLADVCRRLDPTRPYHPSSPAGGADPNSPDEGDRHNWSIWHGEMLPYTAYAEDTTPFASEFGMQAVPDLETIRRGISDEHLWPINDLWTYHTLVHDRLKEYMRAFGHPTSIETYIDLSQRTQAASTGFAVRHYRSRAPHCGGALIWQLNDIWPSVSWSLIDAMRKPKLGYFAIKRALAPVACFIRRDGRDLFAYVMNDDRALSGSRAIYRAQLITFNGEVLWEQSGSITLPAAPGSVEVLRHRLPHIGHVHLRRCALRVEVEAEGDLLASDHCFIADERDLDLPVVALRTKAHRLADGTVLLTLEAPAFAQSVRILGGRPEEHGFDLWPDRPVTVRVHGGVANLRVRHLAGAWQEVSVPTIDG